MAKLDHHLRKGIKFHENWGEFSARDVRHAVFLITQPESIGSDTNTWRTLMGVEKTDTIEDVARKAAEGVEIVNDHQVVFRLKQAAPEFVETICQYRPGDREQSPLGCRRQGVVRQKVVGTGPFEFVERKVGAHVFYKRVENHWRKTPEYKELEMRWVPEGVTRLATLLAEEIHISDVERALQKDAAAKGMQTLSSQLPAIQHEWLFGGLYFASPDKLDTKVPLVDKRVRQAMNLAINRQAIAQASWVDGAADARAWVSSQAGQ